MDGTEPLLYLLHFNDFKYSQLNKVHTFALPGEGRLTSSFTNHLIEKNIQAVISKTHHFPTHQFFHLSMLSALSNVRAPV